MSDRGRRTDIQGLRGLAVLLVVVFHAGWRLPGGYVGVDVFFVISGFVITSLLWSELATTGELRLGHFYARRVKRILPALALLLVVTAAASALLNPISTERMSAITGIAASAFSANAYLYHLGSSYFDPATTLIPLLHTWTLAVEEQFYVVFPLVLVVAHRSVRRRSGAVPLVVVASAVAAVSAASFALSLHLTHGGRVPGIGLPEQFAFYGSPTRAWEFGVGSLLALGAAALARIRTGPAVVLGIGGLVAILASAWVFDGRTAFPGLAALLPVLGAAAVIAGGASTIVGVPRLLGSRALVWLGDLSYSWYLWHWPVIVFALALWPSSGTAATVAAVVSLLPAAASYRYVEQPLRTDRRIVGRRALGVAVVCVALPALAGVALLGVHRVTDRTASVRRWQRSQAAHVDFQHGCVGMPLGADGTAGCTWSVPAPRGDVVLLGDSNAEQYSETLIEAANRAGYRARVATFFTCPFIRMGEWIHRVDQPGCERFVADSTAEVLRTRPSLVVLAARTANYLEDDQVRIGRTEATSSRDPATKARRWEEGLTSVLRTFADAGIPVVVVHPVPTFVHTSTDCAVVRLLLGPCAQHRSRAAVERFRRRSVAAEAAAVARVPLARAIDPVPHLCGVTDCSTQRGDVTMYRDGTHLSVDGARLLTGMFARAIEASARPRA